MEKKSDDWRNILMGRKGKSVMGDLLKATSIFGGDAMKKFRTYETDDMIDGLEKYVAGDFEREFMTKPYSGTTATTASSAPVSLEAIERAKEEILRGRSIPLADSMKIVDSKIRGSTLDKAWIDELKRMPELDREESFLGREAKAESATVEVKPYSATPVVKGSGDKPSTIGDDVGSW